MQMRLGRSRVARPTMAHPSGFEMFMFALLFVAIADAGMLSWLVLHGIAGR